MKRIVPTLLVGILIGFGGAILSLPTLEKWRKKKIVHEAIHDFSLPTLPPGTEVIYAYHKDEFVIEWYGFEIRMAPEEAIEWEAKIRNEPPKKVIEFDCRMKGNGAVEVRLTESHK